MTATAKVKRPLGEAMIHAQALITAVSGACVRIEVAGSLRREKPEVGDIELVAIPRVERIAVVDGPSLFAPPPGAEPKMSYVNRLWEKLDQLVAPDQFAKRGEKYRQFMWRGMQVDLFTAEKGNWGWIYLIRTGSAEFSKHIAQQLNQYGYTSKEGWVGLKHGPFRPIPTPDESEIFSLAHVAAIPPKERSW